METSYRKCADRLARCFAAINESVEEQILGQMIVGGDTFCAFRFEVEVESLTGICRVLAKNSRLWTDFQRAVQGHRKRTHWTMLVEHVFTVGNLEGKLKLLEQTISCPSAWDRRVLAEHLNRIDGEIAITRNLADRRDLATRINEEADFPLIDGLSLRGVTFVFGEHSDLWREFQWLIEHVGSESRDHTSLTNAPGRPRYADDVNSTQ